MIKVVVASKNPVKIAAAKEGFEKMLSRDIEIIGVSTDSGVGAQPMGDEETYMGAATRVKNARELQPDADYWIGIEGGVQNLGGNLSAFAWVVVENREGKIGKAQTGSFVLPEKVTRLIETGLELGEASDQVFQEQNSKQKMGTVGILTDDAIDRTAYYVHAVILALIPFRNNELY